MEHGKAYIKNPNGSAGGQGKWGANEQDLEDFEQEKLIQDWLRENGGDTEFEFKHISSKGTPRNTLIKASFSLDQEIKTDSSGTFADLIIGSDGRDLECGPVVDDFDERLSEAEAMITGVISLARSAAARLWAEKVFRQWLKEQL